MEKIKAAFRYVGAFFRFLWLWIFNILISLDQFLNVFLLFGDPDETISSRAGKGRLLGSFAWTITADAIDLFFLPWERDHCLNSIEWDEGRRLRK